MSTMRRPDEGRPDEVGADRQLITITGGSEGCYYNGCWIQPGATAIFPYEPCQPTMNAEQLARDIESLPEAHKILNGMGASLGPISKRIESAADSIKIHNILKVLDELDRISPPPQGDTTPERVRRVVDELLKLRKDTATLDRVRQCEHAEREEAHAIFCKIRATAGKAMGMSEIGTNGMTTLGMVEELAGRLESARRKCDDMERQVPKQKWSVFPVSGGYRVMRGGEDATPHPVSRATAEAICKELNTRGGS